MKKIIAMVMVTAAFYRHRTCDWLASEIHRICDWLASEIGHTKNIWQVTPALPREREKRAEGVQKYDPIEGVRKQKQKTSTFEGLLKKKKVK